MSGALPGRRPWLNSAWEAVLRATCISLFVLALIFILHFSSYSAFASPDRSNYQAMFDGSPPTSGANALSSFTARRKTVTLLLACGQEADFLDGSTLRDREGADHKIHFADAEDVGEGMLHKILAKMSVYSSWPDFATSSASGGLRCEQNVQYFVFKPKKNASDPDVPDTDALNKLGLDLGNLEDANHRDVRRTMRWRGREPQHRSFDGSCFCWVFIDSGVSSLTNQ